MGRLGWEWWFFVENVVFVAKDSRLTAVGSLWVRDGCGRASIDTSMRAGGGFTYFDSAEAGKRHRVTVYYSRYPEGPRVIRS